jgi:quercetin dioxygenase-like cupin family protein
MAFDLVSPEDGSALALAELRLEPGSTAAIHDAERDSLLYAFAGSGAIALAGEAAALGTGSAALVPAGQEAALEAGPEGLATLVATVGPEADRHAPLGSRELVASLAAAGSEKATGARSFQVLFGPYNGSTRATLFAGFIPPGKAPWHYHLYDEIVWVPEGPGRLHVGEAVTELGPGSAFRLRPRQVHIVENTSPDRELTVIGVFTPAGSPSAAYLTPDIAAEYRFAGE